MPSCFTAVGSAYMPALSEYRNVQTSALATIKQKGYTVWLKEGTGMYWAEKSGWDFAANTPVSLLGLIAMFEWIGPKEYAEYWWRIVEPQIKEVDLLTAAPDYVSRIESGQ